MSLKGSRLNNRALKSWTIVGLIFVAALINYFDRQSLSVVAPRLQADLHLNDREYARIVSLFLMASAFAYALSGFIVDRLGVRRSMACFVGVWSLAEAATSFARSFFGLGLARFALGLGEPGLWVAAPKAVSETMEPRRHSLAIGIYTLGATVGAVVAIPTIVLVTQHLPWRYIFLVDGIAGLLWLPFWWWLYRPNDAFEQVVPSPAAGRFRDLMRSSQLWKFLIARGMTDPVWYFYLFWFPKFLFSARHLNAVSIAHVAWLVYLGGGLGTIGGGWFAGWLNRRGNSIGTAYRRCMMISAITVTISPLAFLAPGTAGTVLVASIVAFAHMAWLVNLSAAILHVFPAQEVGKAFGLVAAGSAVGGMVASEIIGYLVTTHGYEPIFFLMACMHPLALALLWRSYGKRKRDAAVPAELSLMTEF